MQRSHVIIAVLCVATILGLALSPEPLMAQTPSGCADVVTNGGFETVSDWLLGASPSPPQYSGANRHTGNWSLLLGISDGVNRESFSSARQTVTIPPGAQSTTLAFWVYNIASGAPDTDYMELALLSPDGSTILAKPWYSHSDNRAWSQLVFDISAWRGRTFQLYFNVFNDGLGGMAQMYLDDVSLIVCPGGSGGGGGGGLVTPALPTGAPITPTRGACPNPVLPCFATPKTPSAEATPQPTQTTPAADQQSAQSTPVVIAPPAGGAALPAIIEPAATGQGSPIVITVTPKQSGASPAVIQPELVLPPLIELTPAPAEVVPLPSATLPPPAYWSDPILNGGFEENLTYWDVDASGDAPLIVDAEVHSGLRAVRLGAAQGAVAGTSSIVQDIVVPAGFDGVALDFWVYPWAGADPGNDYQEAALLAPDGSTRTLLWRDQSDAREWTRKIVPITGSSGQSAKLQFSVYNDGAGDSTGMILDDISLVALGPETQVQIGAAASSDGAQPTVTDPVEPSVTRIALVVTALPPAPVLVQSDVEPEIPVVTPSSSSTPETPAGSRRITDQWPKYWWLIPIGFIAVFVLIWLLARRSK
jgi:hypothetical protein